MSRSPRAPLSAGITIDAQDYDVLVEHLGNSWFGDADLDGEFNSGDFVQALLAGKYETSDNAGWAEGDWNGHGMFDIADFGITFVDGGYQQGPRTDVTEVPGPRGVLLLLFDVVGVLRRSAVCSGTLRCSRYPTRRSASPVAR